MLTMRHLLVTTQPSLMQLSFMLTLPLRRAQCTAARVGERCVRAAIDGDTGSTYGGRARADGGHARRYRRKSAIVLHIRYAMSGSKVRYLPTRDVRADLLGIWYLPAHVVGHSWLWPIVVSAVSSYV
eukprot:1234441-Rhodomonas_salina.2